jgi:hypothetical protein
MISLACACACACAPAVAIDIDGQISLREWAEAQPISDSVVSC